MAEEALNLSLDDIIKKNAENKKKGSAAGRTATRSRGGKGGRGGDRSGIQVRSLGVQKPVFKTSRGRGPAGRGAARAGSGTREPPRDLDELEGNKPWGHTGYNAIEAGTRRPVQQRLGVAADPCRLEISNLDYNVTDNDIKELFSVCGPLKKHGVVYEARSGRSEGKAFVVYERRQDAEQALEQYDNVALDGKPMKIAFATGGLQLASGIRVGATSVEPRKTNLQLSRTFNKAAADANIGRNRGMRSNGMAHMDMA